ncbi:MAG: hypothetical protein QHC90_00845 [Shinella sp.]|nr:hypothetical protein [Shinella sp.]
MPLYRSSFLCLLIWLAASAPAMAQADSGKCAAPATPPQNGSATDRSQNLTRKLDDCNGVLKPPPTGDPEMVEPGPDTGETPVIKPGEVHPDANPENESK